ncbi:thioredoxin-domain-containing protein [Patellaria atrata CBS 101060]|uniref:protein disulfide-isomerase n=1 Tax=Patellaria atrata CBS 101060 TaxID=1346257 RepID=A0A9P4S6X6_9PEZI|nr:thioredoxin-domain-containing protein [Patellaria atrata CBS 101060]
MYTKSSPVLQVDAKSYDRLIAKSNHTSIVEFFAPWCGHCKNLKPAYEKAAKNLKGLAKVAAVDCDDESNKAFCGGMGVQGFPTLKIVKPGKKPGRPVVEDYQGARSAKAIVDAVIEKIPNHVKRIQDKDLDDWLSENNSTGKVVLFTEKGTTGPLFKALAIDYLGSVNFGQIRNNQKKAIETFGITSFPTLVLLPGGEQSGIVYDGDMKKESLSTFISQVAEPNPDPASQKAKSKSTKSSSKKDEAKATKEPELPTESPDPQIPTDDSQKPIVIPEAEAIPTLAQQDEVILNCLTEKSQICVLALLPIPTDLAAPLPEHVSTALASLAEVAHHHKQRGAKIFPFFAVPAENEAGALLREALSLRPGDALEIVATNAKRGWWRLFEGENYGVVRLEDWIDSIKMGDATKLRLPDSIVLSAEEVAQKEAATQQAKERVKEGKPLKIVEGEDGELMIEIESPEDEEGQVQEQEHDEL